MNAAFPPYGDPGVPPQPAPRVEDSPSDYVLSVRQQPRRGKQTPHKEKDRKPIDPPPILQLTVSSAKDPHHNYLQSPYFFMSCALVKTDEKQEDPPANSLIGTVVSSLHKLKDTDNQDGGFFVFGDLTAKPEGTWRLLFTLYQMRDSECVHLSQIVSDAFTVYSTKSYPGLVESTFLTRSFSDQGVRLRLRKDSRSISTRKRNAAAADLARKAQDPSDRGLPGRANSSEDGQSPFGGQPGPYYDPSPGHFQYDRDGMSKRQRMAYRPEDVGQPYAQDMGQYPRPGYSPQVPIPTSMAPVGMPSSAAASMSYAGLARLDTHMPPHGAPAGPVYPSSANRHSPPHSAFAFSSIQNSPASTHPYHHASAPVTSMHAHHNGSPHGDYKPPLYASNASADASPRSHPAANPSITPSSTSSPSEANYTATGPMSQSQFPGYAYAHQGLNDAQSQLPPPNSMTSGRINGLSAGDHFSAGLGVYDISTDVGRHNGGQTS